MTVFETRKVKDYESELRATLLYWLSSGLSVRPLFFSPLNQIRSIWLLKISPKCLKRSRVSFQSNGQQRVSRLLLYLVAQAWPVVTLLSLLHKNYHFMALKNNSKSDIHTTPPTTQPRKQAQVHIHANPNPNLKSNPPTILLQP